MATKTYYLTNTTATEGWRVLSESAQTVGTNTDGWVVSTGATNHSEYAVGVERAATTFTGTTVPDGTLDTTLKDAFRSTSAINGTFATANWTFTFVVRGVTSASTQNGRIRFRVIRANADGSSATEITSGQQSASLTGAITATGTDFTSSLTVSIPGAAYGPTQYLFIQIAWERTAAGPMTTSDVNWQRGSSASAGTRIVTADFTPSQNVTTPGLGAVLQVDSSNGTTADTGRAIQGLASGAADQMAKCSFDDAAVGTFNLAKVAVQLYRVGSPTDALNVDLIRTVTGDEEVYATAPSIPVSSLPTSLGTATWVLVDFPTVLTLTAGPTYSYSLRLSRTGARDTVNYPVWAGASGDRNSLTAYGVYGASDAWELASGEIFTRFYTPPLAQVFAPTLTQTLGITLPRITNSVSIFRPELVRRLNQEIPTLSSHTLVQYYDPASAPEAFTDQDSDWFQAVDPLNEFGQTFSASARFSAIEVLLASLSGADGTFTLKVRAGDTPVGTVIATSTRPVADTLPGMLDSFRWLRFTFPTIDPGGSPTLYTWTLTRDGASGGAGDSWLQFVDNENSPISPYSSHWFYEDGGWSTVLFAAYPTKVLAESVFAPTVAVGAPADQAVTTTLITSTAVVREPTLAYGIAGPTAPVIDGYHFANRTGGTILQIAESQVFGVAQSFIGDGRAVAACQAVLARISTSTGTYCAKIYATTGTFGTTSRPSGSALTVSETLTIESLPTSFQTQTLVFPTPILLTAGTVYALAIEVLTSTGTGLSVAGDAKDPTHPGNYSSIAATTWSVASVPDLVFAVIPQTAAAFAPTVAVVTTGTTIPSTAALFEPTVTLPVTAQAVTTANIGGVFSDSFAYSDGALATVSGGKYATPSGWGAVDVDDNLAESVGGGEHGTYLTSYGGSATAQWSSITLAVFGQYIGPTVFNKISAATMYLLELNSTTLWRIWRVTAGSFALIWDFVPSGVALAVGDVVTLEVVLNASGQPVLTAKYNGNVITDGSGAGGSFTDTDTASMITSGAPGFRLWDTGVSPKVSRFQAGSPVLGHAQTFAPTVAHVAAQTVVGAFIGIVEGGSELNASELGAFELNEAPAVTGYAQVFAPSVEFSVDLDVTAGTIAPTTALFVPVVTPGPTALVGFTIPSTAQLFMMTVTVGSVTITAGTRPAIPQLFTPTIFTLAFATGAHISSTAQLHVPSVALTVTTGTIASGIVVRIPSVAVGPVAVTTPPLLLTTSLNVPIISQGAVTIETAFISAGNQRFTPTVFTLSFASGVHVSSTAQLYPPTVISIQTITAGTVGSLLIVRPPSITIGAATVYAGHVAPTANLYPLTILPQPVQVETAPRSSTVQVFVPTVFTITFASGVHVSSTVQLYPPSLDLNVITARITATPVLRSPSVALRVLTPAIDSTLVVYGPILIEAIPKPEFDLTPGSFGEIFIVLADNLEFIITSDQLMFWVQPNNLVFQVPPDQPLLFKATPENVEFDLLQAYGKVT